MTSQHKTNRISRWWEHVCAAICSHGLTWTNGTGGPSESEGLSWTARWNMWAVIICFEEKQSNAEGGIPVLTECHHHRGAPLFTFTLSPVLSLFYIPSAQTFLSHCIRGLFSGLLRARVWAACGHRSEETWVPRSHSLSVDSCFVPLQRASVPFDTAA